MNEYSFNPKTNHITETTKFAIMKKARTPATAGNLRITRRKNRGWRIMNADKKTVMGTMIMVDIVKKLNHVLSMFT